MALYPEVQRKAREELDRVVGPTTLATFEHRSQLPFIDALVKEVFRWHPASPLGAPHITQEDQIWDGYLLPKGALLLPNIWLFHTRPLILLLASKLTLYLLGRLPMIPVSTTTPWCSSQSDSSREKTPRQKQIP